MATPQSSKRAISDIWKFLDHEEPDYQSSGGVRAGINNRPSKEFLRPAAFRSSIASVESQHFHDDIQLPTFAQKYSGNVLDGSLKPSRSPFRLPRTVINDEEDPNALYAVPKKLPKSTAGKRDSPPSISYAQGFSGSLFKRYEAGSILSSISSENPPVVYHDRETLVRELNGNPEDSHADNVDFSTVDDLWAYARPYKRLAVKREGNSGGRCSCCSGKVIVAVVVAVMVAAAVVAIAVGVSVSATTSNSNSGPSSSSNSTAVTTLLVTESPGVTVAVTKLNTVTLNTAWLAFRSIFPEVVKVNDTLTIQPASTGTTASSEIANNQAPTSLPGNGSVSSVTMVSNNTEISMVTATSPLSHNVSTNSANSTSASDNNNSRIEVSVSTPLSYNGTTTNGYVITNSVSPSQKNTMLEIITKVTTPSDGAMVRTTTNTDRAIKTSALDSKSWTSVSASLTGSTTPKLPVISSTPQAVTTSQGKSSPEASTTSVGQSVSSSTSTYVAKMTSVSVNLLTTLSNGNSVGEDSSTSRVVSSITTASASTSTVGSNTSSVV